MTNSSTSASPFLPAVVAAAVAAGAILLTPVGSGAAGEGTPQHRSAANVTVTDTAVEHQAGFPQQAGTLPR